MVQVGKSLMRFMEMCLLSLSVRAKILLGCTGLALVTIIVGLLSQGIQQSLSDNALRIYDQSLQSMNTMRLAQTVVLGISRDLALDGKSEGASQQLQSVLDALDVAHERAMSPGGAIQALSLLQKIRSLQAVLDGDRALPSRDHFVDIERSFDMAVSTYAADGFRMRSEAEALVARAHRQITMAMIGSAIAALLITVFLSRAVVPSIRKAVDIATSIASGRLDNAIEGRGRSETSVLLRALASMQDSIAEKIARIEELMKQQASGHVAEIAQHHARFETAIEHLTVGLCMLDDENRLLVQNSRYTQMFDLESDDGSLLAREARRRGPSPLTRDQPLTYDCDLSDGRTIKVCEAAMSDGGRVVTYEDVTERRRAEDRLNAMLRHDALTGLPNRVFFREMLEGLTSQGNRTAFSVLCLDLDRFKMVNDTLGHPVGDSLLRAVASRLLQVVGWNDTVVRLGGDEFAIIQREMQSSDATQILADAVIESFGQPFEVDGHRISITASVGMAGTSGSSPGPDTLLKNADIALYSAKADGKAIARVFDPSMATRTEKRLQMEVDLRKAIDEQQFEIFYQPLMHAQTHDITGFEALIRWRHPEQGLILPGDFIDVAEETGLILEIGRWVIRQACREACAWPDDIKLAVNLSPAQFRCPMLLHDVTTALQTSGLKPWRLEFEITESLMLKNTDATLALLNQLRSLKIGVSMDDFGTGYSSLSYLRSFPFDKIKIDRSFVRDLVDGSEGMSIVRAVVNLGHSLQMKVVAEGVENAEQAELLRGAGCDQLQGYFFSRPQSAMMTGKFIDQNTPSLRALRTA